MPEQNPQQNTDALQEATLQNQDSKLTENNQLLETSVSQAAKADEEKIALAEASLQAIDEGGNKVAEAIKELKPLSEAGNFINDFLKAIKGEKGDSPTDEELLKLIKPSIPEKGKDYFTDKEIKEIVSEVQSKIRMPEDGERGRDAEVDYDSIVKSVLSKIRKPEDGLDGRDADEDRIIKEVLKKIPSPKDGKDGKSTKEVKVDEIIKMLKNKLSINDLKDAPEFKPKLGWAGTGYMREITDYQDFLNKLKGGTIETATTIKVATGTVDEINKDFVFASKPSVIIINGGTYREDKGWSWNAATLTATLDIVVGTNGDIYGL